METKYEWFKKNTIYGYILQVPADPLKRKEVRNNPKYNHMFGGAGVYLYVTNKNKDVKRPRIYAGKATHLDARANDHSRLKNKDYLFLIKIGDRTESCHMDENWRQQVEHKLIDELMKNQLQRGYDCLNKSYESKSLMHIKDRKVVDSWYGKLRTVLAAKFGLIFFKDVSESSNRRKVKLLLAYEDGKNFISKSNFAEFYGKDLIKVREGSFCRPSKQEPKYNFPIDIRYQDFKWELIKSGVLNWDDEEEHYVFMDDMWFTSLTQMAAIVYNTQRGAKKWIVSEPPYDPHNEWTVMSEHPMWIDKP